LIPHYVDLDNDFVTHILNTRDDILLIDVRDEVDTVLEQIASCEMILATAMHGLIFADSFGIPNLWLRMSDKMLGGDFKFLDYYSALDIKGEDAKAFDLRHQNLPLGQDLEEFVINNYKVCPDKVAFVCERLCAAFDVNNNNTSGG